MPICYVCTSTTKTKLERAGRIIEIYLYFLVSYKWAGCCWWLVALVRCSGGASPGARSRDHRALPSQSHWAPAEAEATLAPAPGRWSSTTWSVPPGGRQGWHVQCCAGLYSANQPLSIMWSLKIGFFALSASSDGSSAIILNNHDLTPWDSYRVW